MIDGPDLPSPPYGEYAKTMSVERVRGWPSSPLRMEKACSGQRGGEVRVGASSPTLPS